MLDQLGAENPPELQATGLGAYQLLWRCWERPLVPSALLHWGLSLHGLSGISSEPFLFLCTSLVRLGRWGLKKGSGPKPRGNSTPQIPQVGDGGGGGDRHTMGEEILLGQLWRWGPWEREKEPHGVQIPSSAAPSLHCSFATRAGGPKNSPRGAITGRPGDLLGSTGRKRAGSRKAGRRPHKTPLLRHHNP